ncbi:MAG: DIP1984 family protein [Ignavibacterium sp.]|nr:DIP1984 family protein [Ignavibacterium sp.]
MTQYTLQRALDKLNITEKKINKAIVELRDLVAVVVGEKPPVGFSSVKEYENYVKAKMQSLKDLLSFYEKLKSKIIYANATTFIEVNGEQMTIAEAIDRRKNLSKKYDILHRLTEDYTSKQTLLSRKENEFLQTLDTHLQTLYGKEGKQNIEQHRELLSTFYEMNEPKFLDPLNLKHEIEKLKQEIDAFEYEIKFALTEANVKTIIEIEE